MWNRMLLCAAAVMAAALFAFLGARLITAYGTAREAEGQAEGKLGQMPAILAANTRAERAALAARDRVIAAEVRHGEALIRMIPLILSAQDKVNAYAQTDAGRAACLGSERVRDITADRASLFPPDAPSAAGADHARSMLADTDPDRRERGDE